MNRIRPIAAEFEAPLIWINAAGDEACQIAPITPYPLTGTMAAMDRPLSTLAALHRGIRSWWKRIATLRELDHCEGRDLQRILHDLNVSKAELTSAVTQGVCPEVLLPQMLQELNLPADGIKASYPSVEADLRRVCAHCPETTRCRKELHDHTAAENYREFCLNSMTLEALQVEAANETRRSPEERLPAVVKARWPKDID